MGPQPLSEDMGPRASRLKRWGPAGRPFLWPTPTAYSQASQRQPFANCPVHDFDFAAPLYIISWPTITEDLTESERGQ